MARAGSSFFIGNLLRQDDPASSHFGALFARLTTEVLPAGSAGRLLGYECHAGEDAMRLLGLEVPGISQIPTGLLAWEFGADRWRLWAPDGAFPRVSWEGDLRWEWRDLASDGHCCGDIALCCPPDWGLGDRPCAFWTSGDALVEANGPPDEVLLVDADPAWPAAFAEFSAWLLSLLGPALALRIEHYGSTSIPGMPAKPIIDALMEVPSFAAARRGVLPRLHGNGWEYWWYEDHMIFIKRDAHGRRTHHLHLAPRGHRLWDGLLFRDYLRAHPDDAARYASLKRALAEQHRDDREAYTRAKTEFVQEIGRLISHRAETT